MVHPNKDTSKKPDDSSPDDSSGNSNNSVEQRVSAASNGGAEGAAAAPREEKSPEQGNEELRKRIQELESQLKEKDNRYLYLYAEFDNFKKRMAKERQDLVKFGWEPVAVELLQVIDNLERALAHMPPSTDKSLRDGLNMVLSQFKATL